jgi:DNA replication protein DnaC
MTGISANIDQLVHTAETQSIGYMDYSANLFGAEAQHREANDLKKRLKVAQLPRSNDLEAFDHTRNNGLSKSRFNQLRELNWLDQLYNLILMGPSGTGKTYLAAGLCADAVHKGYKAYFRTMEEIMTILKLKDITRSATTDYKHLCKAHLIAIDDIMLFPIEKNQAIALFNFINQLYEKTSFIITTNKMPADWATLLDDEVLATALLDRLLYHCEIINLTGKSYRLENRKTIFDTQTEKLPLTNKAHLMLKSLVYVAIFSAFLIDKNCVEFFTDYTSKGMDLVLP